LDEEGQLELVPEEILEFKEKRLRSKVIRECLIRYLLLIYYSVLLIKIFAIDLLFCPADLIHWGFLDAFQLYV
jgi:hypothetical protein